MVTPDPSRSLPSSWRDHADRPVDRPDPPSIDATPFYLPIGEFQGDTYRRNAFAAHTETEIDALVGRLELQPGERILDVGCGDGRHLRSLARRGIGGVGIDVSPALVAAARDAAAVESSGWPDGVEVRFEVADARALPPADTLGGPFDAAWTLCQGAFGTSRDTDPAVLGRLVAAVPQGGRVAVTAFHALFAARHLVDGDAFDPVHLHHHQTSEVRGPDDARASFDLWTAAYTVPELVRLASDAGLRVDSVSGCEPGRYGDSSVALDDPELLLVGARR